eukprot:gene30604-36978_t
MIKPLNSLSRFSRQTLPLSRHSIMRSFMSSSSSSIASVSNSLSDLASLASRLAKPKVIFVLGGPGAGKGTQCELLSRDFGLTHLSAGELLRAERQSGSKNGQLIESYLKEGKIVPVEISLSLLKREILSNPQCYRYLIDGFPRNFDNLHGWMQAMPSVCDVESIMFIDCPEEQLEKRILSRGLTSNRSDDNIQTVKKRFVTYHADTLSVIEHLRSTPSSTTSSYRFISIAGEGDKEQVYSSFKSTISTFLEEDLRTLHGMIGGVVMSRTAADRSVEDVLSRFGVHSDMIQREKQILANQEDSCQYPSTIVIPPSVDATLRAKQTYPLKSGGGVVEREWVLEKGGWRLVSVK